MNYMRFSQRRRQPLRVPQKVHFYTREVNCFMSKKELEMDFKRKIYRWWGSNGREGASLWTAAATTNVTNASFKSSTVPLQTTLLACEPSERKSKETAAVLVSCSQNYGYPIIYSSFREFM